MNFEMAIFNIFEALILREINFGKGIIAKMEFFTIYEALNLLRIRKSDIF